MQLSCRHTPKPINPLLRTLQPTTMPIHLSPLLILQLTFLLTLAIVLFIRKLRLSLECIYTDLALGILLIGHLEYATALAKRQEGEGGLPALPDFLGSTAAQGEVVLEVGGVEDEVVLGLEGVFGLLAED